MRKNCNFKLPKPFVILSNKALMRNDYVKYIIYPDLSRFKKACLSCPYIYRADNRYYCKLNNNEFMLKFYGILEGIPSGVLLCVGGVPSHIKAHRVGVAVESYFSKHSRRHGDRVLKTLKVSSGDTPKRRSAFPVQSKQGGRSPKVRSSSDRSSLK